MFISPFELCTCRLIHSVLVHVRERESVEELTLRERSSATRIEKFYWRKGEILFRHRKGWPYLVHGQVNKRGLAGPVMFCFMYERPRPISKAMRPTSWDLVRCLNQYKRKDGLRLESWYLSKTRPIRIHSIVLIWAMAVYRSCWVWSIQGPNKSWVRARSWVCIPMSISGPQGGTLLAINGRQLVDSYRALFLDLVTINPMARPITDQFTSSLQKMCIYLIYLVDIS